jgi:capsular polysaccharide transport system permease protein
MVSLGPIFRENSFRYSYLGTRHRIWPALFFRDMAGGEGFLGIIKRLLEPAIMTMATIALSWLISRHPPYGDSILLWSSTGVAPIFLFVHVSKYIVRSPATKGAFIIDFDHCLVTAMLEFLFVTLGIAGFFAILYFTQTTEALPINFAQAVRAWFTVAAMAFGVGLICRTLSRLFRVFHMMYPAMNRLLLHMSGAYFLVDDLPPELRGWLVLNPLVPAVTWFRLGFFPQFPTHMFSLSYLMSWAVIACVIGIGTEFMLGDRIID